MTRNYLPGRWELAPFGRDFFEHDYEIRKPNYQKIIRLSVGEGVVGADGFEPPTLCL